MTEKNIFRSKKFSTVYLIAIFLCGALILNVMINPAFKLGDTVFDDGNEIENHHDILLMKYNSSGTQLWAITWGWNNSFEEGYDLKLDRDNNIIIVGRSNGFNNNTNYDVCLVKFNYSGAILWNVSWGGIYGEEGHAIAVDNESNIFIAGYMTEYKGVGLTEFKAFVAKFNPNGDKLWNVTHDGVIFRDIFIDNNSFLYVTGASDNETIISKYSTNGIQIWNTTWGM